MRSKASALGHFGFMRARTTQYGVTDPNDLNWSAAVAGTYLGDLYRRYHDQQKAVAAYN